MKVAMVTPRYEKDIRGGGEISCKLLVDTLRTLGIDVDVISGDELFPKSKDTKILNMLMYKYLKKRIDKYDIFHTYNMSLLPTIGLLTKKYDISSVGTMNGHVFSPTFERRFSKHPARSYRIVSFILRTQIKYIKRFTALGEFWREAWINDGIPADKIQVIPNMIPPNYTYKGYMPEDKGIVNILNVGNYAPWRDMDMLLDAYSKFPKLDMILTIVGSGWEEKIKRYTGKNELMYFPQVDHDDLKDIYGFTDIYIQPYTYFGIGRTLLEAALNEAAIITTGRSQDFPHISGCINYFTNSAELQLHLQTLIKNKALREDQGKQISRVVRDNFNPQTVTEKYVKIYEEIL